MNTYTAPARIFALLTTEGTAISETAHCMEHASFRREVSIPDDAARPLIWTAIRDNDCISCNHCGAES